jgi:DNA-binding CsgD family transcriptional regulator
VAAHRHSPGISLAPAELRVLFSSIEIDGVSEVAQVLSITEATVRTPSAPRV